MTDLSPDTLELLAVILEDDTTATVSRKDFIVMGLNSDLETFDLILSYLSSNITVRTEEGIRLSNIAMDTGLTPPELVVVASYVNAYEEVQRFVTKKRNEIVSMLAVLNGTDSPGQPGF